MFRALVIIMLMMSALFCQSIYGDDVSAATVQSIASAPVRLKIPRLVVNAPIETVALNVDGSMGMPKAPRNTAWFQQGPRPGEIGSAVIIGHVNWLYGATAVFANLYKLKPGDKISVQDEAGASTTFVVREVKLYNASADASEVFISTDGKAHLNLITCAGVWSTRYNQYTKRLVVFADKE